jgi:hypothetical protein
LVALLSSFTIEIQHVNAIYQLTEYRKDAGPLRSRKCIALRLHLSLVGRTQDQYSIFLLVISGADPDQISIKPTICR